MQYVLRINKFYLIYIIFKVRSFKYFILILAVMTRITIIRISKPAKKDINSELQWLGNSLGLFSSRDKDKSCFRIFIELLKSAKQHKPLSSDDLAEKLNLTRGTIIHHIDKLMDSGLVKHEKNKYLLRVEKLSNLIEEVEKDLQRTCRNLREVAHDIDNWLGL